MSHSSVALKPESPRPSVRTQSQFYYDAVRQAGETNALFLELVATGLTREELAACIKRRPQLWSRFERWLEKLPSRPRARAN